MSNVRLLSYIIVIFLLFQVINAKPFLGLTWLCAVGCSENSMNDLCGCGPEQENEPASSINVPKIVVKNGRGFVHMNIMPWNLTLPTLLPTPIPTPLPPVIGK